MDPLQRGEGNQRTQGNRPDQKTSEPEPTCGPFASRLLPRSRSRPAPPLQHAEELGTVLHDALDFINCHIPPKPCVPEPRTFIGEVRTFRVAARREHPSGWLGARSQDWALCHTSVRPPADPGNTWIAPACVCAPPHCP